MAILAVLSLVGSLLAQLTLSTPASSQVAVPCNVEDVDDIQFINQDSPVRSTAHQGEPSVLMVRAFNDDGNFCTGVDLEYADDNGALGTADVNDSDLTATTDGFSGAAFFVRPMTDAGTYLWRVWADENFNGLFDVGETNRTGNYEVYDAFPDGITIAPIDSVHPSGTDPVTFTGRLLDQHDRGLPVWLARFEADRGQNGAVDDSASVTTDANGFATYNYPTDPAGHPRTDDITFCDDDDAPGSPPSGIRVLDCSGAGVDESVTTSVEFQDPEASGILAEPNTASNAPGTSHTIDATVFDQFGDTVGAGVQVKFEFFAGSPSDLDGNTPASPDRTATTDGFGVASTTYSQAGTGTDLLCVWIGADPDPTMAGDNTNGTCNGEDLAEEDPDSPQDVVEKRWVTGDPADVQTVECIAGCDDGNQTGSGVPHTFTVQARDNGNPVEAVEISMIVESGPNQQPGLQRDDFCTTDAAGQCDIDLDDPGVGNEGVDNVRFWVDQNGNLVFDASEPNDTTTKTWHGAPFGLQITPIASSAAVGACNAYTATLTDQAGQPVPGAQIHHRQVHSDPTATVGSCTPSADQGPNPSPSSLVAAPATNDRTHVTDTGTNTDGEVTFGITANRVGSSSVQAFFDADANNEHDPGEPEATASKEWTPGGAAAVETLEVDPQTDTNPTNTSHTIEATALNAAGDGVPGVTVRTRIDSGPNQATFAPPGGGVWCVTGNDGTCDGSYTGSGGVGTDELTFWVNQPAPPGGSATLGPDAHEPQANASKEWVAPEPVDDLEITCEGTIANVNDQNCVNPTDDTDEVFTAEATDAVGDPVPGALIAWDLDNPTNLDDPADVIFVESGARTAECTTVADGTCSVTVQNPTPDDGDQANVHAEVAGDPTKNDQGSKRWEDRVVDDLDLQPEIDVNQIGTDHTVVGTLSDQFGDPVAGATVNITSDPGSRNTLGVTCSGLTTDAAGEVSCTYTDHGGPGAPGTDDLTAQSGALSATAQKIWIDEPVVASEVAIDMENCDGDPDNFNDPDWDDTAAPNPVGDTHEVCASARTAGGQVLFGHEMNFTLTGVGSFVDADGDDIGTSTTATIDASGRASVEIRSTEVGTSNVTAEKDGQSDSGDKPWQGRPARILELDPATDENVFGSNHIVTGIVTDAHGNPVPGQQVRFELSGDGTFSDGTCCVKTETTNAQGRASVSITHDAVGSSTVDATIQPGVPFLIPAGPQGNECNEPANSPEPGDPAGVCDAQAQKDWVDEPPPPALCPGFEHLTGHIHIVGTPGDDVLIATSDDPHVICGLAGDDHIEGGAGDDVLDGGPGDDVMFGRDGDDVMFGRSGNDDMRGGPGDDIMRGGPGNDVLRGGPGDDQIFGGDGADTIFGGSGNDVIRGGPGNDVIRTGPGDNIARAGSGSNRVIGGSGNNNLHGGSGDDLLRASGNGDNRLRGAGGDDRLVGAPGPNSSTRFHCGPGFDIAVLRGGTNFVHPSCNQVVDQT